MIAKQDLLMFKKRALRLNLWFRVLSRTERAIVDLTLKCVERIRSPVLETMVNNITNKVLKALEYGFISKAEEIGQEIAKQMCRIAQKWGNSQAFEWKLDVNFVRFLGVITLNQ